MADDKKIAEIRDRFELAASAVNFANEQMLDDLRFLANKDNYQWPTKIRQDRNNDGRPCLVINKLPAFGDQLKGDLRQNTPSIKIKPVDDNADPETAEVLTGLIRNIEVQSTADTAYDTAGESAINAGRGCFRIITEYADDDVFEQDIRIKRIKNPFTVVWEPTAQEADKSDAMYCFVTEKVSRDEFKRQFPDAALQDFQAKDDRDTLWCDDATIRVAEYFWKEPTKRTLYLLQDPRTGDTMVSETKREGFEVINSRKVETHQIKWLKTNGVEILEGPLDWPGKYIPVVEVTGKEINIENETIQYGYVRYAKDSQRLYNFSRSHDAEMTALAPKSPYLVTGAQISNYKTIWDQANKKNFPYLPYDNDPNQPGGKPYREPPIHANTALLAQIQMSDQELHDTVGLQLASMGKTSNEKSGRAIVERKREGDRGSFSFSDNLIRAITYAGKVIVDLLPKIYDTPRVVRVLGEDGKADMVPVNQPFQDEAGKELNHDLTVGKYDVVVSVGPSYATQREEAADAMIQFFGAMPPEAQMLILDLLVHNMDWPGAGELEKRLKMLLPPGVADDPAAPPQPPPPPDPAQMMEMEKDAADIQKTLIEVQKIKAQIEQILAETRKTRMDSIETEDRLDNPPIQ